MGGYRSLIKEVLALMPIKLNLTTIKDGEQPTCIEIDFDIENNIEQFFLCSPNSYGKPTEHLMEIVEEKMCTSLNLALEALSSKRQVDRDKNLKPHLSGELLISDRFRNLNIEMILTLLNYVATLNHPLELNNLHHASIPISDLPVMHKDGIDIQSIDDYLGYLHAHSNPGFIAFSCCDLTSIILSTLTAIAIKNKQINKCALCGKYFLPESRSDEKYCDFKNSEYALKTCKEAAKLIKQKERESNNEVDSLRKKIYNRLRIRAERTDSEKDREALYNFQKEREKIKAEIKAGAKQQEDLIKWLREKEKETK